MSVVSVAPGPVCPPGSGWVVWLIRPGASMKSQQNFEIFQKDNIFNFYALAVDWDKP